MSDAAIEELIRSIIGWANFPDWSSLLFSGEALFTLLLLAVGWTGGWLAERRHLASLARRGKLLADIEVRQVKRVPVSSGSDGALIIASVVLSKGMFQALSVRLRKIFGGNVRGYETLLHRARREAILRLKEAARERQSCLVVNVRLQATNIVGGDRPIVEVLAYGTAIG